MSSQSRLLDLPPELRGQIYDAVIALPLDCQIARQTHRREQQTDAATAADTDRLPIPWLDLMLVCKLITKELHHHVHRDTSGNTTYELEVDNLTSLRGRGIAKKVTWRQIPCLPSRVRTLQAELVFISGTQFWGNGGPNPILSQLYQVLNSLIHRGPLLVRQSPLGSNIHLDTLILHLRVVKPDLEEQPPKGYWPLRNEPVEQSKKRLRNDLEDYISIIVNRGVLFGAVDRIVCRSADDDDGDATKWDVRRETIGDMAEWNRYQFNWGVPGSSSLEASGVLPA
ncbi:hypothetical protein B0H14DRAFT_3877659 [Mycena olivaceomarginata]|nr:hypothetical protein B0H14DRAFT_3877659 [Mycena olivaceomarginata]